MELRQLRYFIRAAQLSNFTEAANQLFISQSTLSQQIKTLEDEIATPLFDRIGKRVRLTEAGQLFLPYAQKTLRDAEEGRQVLRDLEEMTRGTLMIGATYGLMDLLVKAVLRFKSHYPMVKFSMFFGETVELKQQLDSGGIDLMLSFLSGGEPLFSARLSLIGPSSDPLMKRKKIELKQLQELPLLLPTKGYSIRNLLDSYIELEPEMEVNDIPTLLKLVEKGKWYTILMDTTLFDKQQLLCSVPINIKNMERTATLHWPEASYRKKSALKFADCLQAISNDG